MCVHVCHTMKYKVTATDAQGRDQEFRVDAPDEKQAAATIRARGFFPFEIALLREVDPQPQPVQCETTSQAPATQTLSRPPGQSDDRILCIACGSPAVQLLSVTKRDLGAALFADLIAGTAVGVTAGRKSLVLNVCMKCGAQWAPGTVETLDQIKKRQDQQGEPFAVGCLAIVIAFIVLMIIGSLAK